MKIIDLLNKIAKSEEVPKKIKFENYIYIWRDIQKDYFCEQINHSLESIIGEYLFGNLNLEVKIIEEDKKIEKIDIMSDEATPNSYYILNEHGTKCYLTKHSKVIADRVNLLIDKVNSLENKQ